MKKIASILIASFEAVGPVRFVNTGAQGHKKRATRAWLQKPFLPLMPNE
jgi:hypothetical protein